MDEHEQHGEQDEASLQRAKQIWRQRGDELAKQKHFEEALFAYEQVIRLDGQDALAYKSKSMMLAEPEILALWITTLKGSQTQFGLPAALISMDRYRSLLILTLMQPLQGITCVIRIRSINSLIG
jgi:tetratricopeptide (TPR) repeat protein